MYNNIAFDTLHYMSYIDNLGIVGMKKSEENKIMVAIKYSYFIIEKKSYTNKAITMRRYLFSNTKFLKI